MLLLRVQPFGHLPLVYELLLQLDDFFIYHFVFFLFLLNQILQVEGDSH